MVAKDAVIVGRLVEIFDDPLVEFLDIDVAIVIEVVFDVLDDLEDDAACERQVVVLFLAYYLVELREDVRGPADVLFVHALHVQERKVDQLVFVASESSNQGVR